jgi:hypothetical protein
MRRTIGCAGGLVVLAVGLSAVTASAQDPPAAAPAAREPRFSLEAAAGLETYYTGHAESLAFGFAPSRSLTLLVIAHQSHTQDEIEFYPDGYATERGGTERFVAAELRYAFFSRKRVSPYVLIGTGAGTSRPNVNEFFPDEKKRNIGVFFYGGGVRIPVRPSLDTFVDIRLIMAAEAKSDYFGVRMPVRAGVAWRF